MSNKISTYVLYALIAITVVICGMFYLGGVESVDTTAGAMDAPSYTSTMIGWAETLVIIAAVATLAFALMTFFSKAAYSFKSVLTPLISVATVGLLLLITYFAADTNPINITGYEGSQDPWVYQLTNMCIVSAIVLATVAIIVTLFGFLAKYIK